MVIKPILEVVVNIWISVFSFFFGIFRKKSRQVLQQFLLLFDKSYNNLIWIKEPITINDFKSAG
jgi:hypothetical protein